MNRDSYKCRPGTHDLCDAQSKSYTHDKVGFSEILDLISEVLGHSLSRGLDCCYQLCWSAGRHLVVGEVKQCRMHLGRAIAVADDPATWLIRDALQLLKGIDGGGA